MRKIKYYIALLIIGICLTNDNVSPNLIKATNTIVKTIKQQ